jgi:TetR/AcrR family transcriptional repressor of bet genes
MPRPQNTEQRRGEIVRGLAAVMAEQGYAKATIRDIASAAGLTPGLVHYHFGSKQEILLALIERLAITFRSRLERTAVGPVERIFAVVDALVGTERGIESDAVACWVVVGAEAVRQPEVRQLYQSLMAEALHELTRVFAEAMQKSGRPAATAADAALAVVAAVEGFFRLAAGAPSCVPRGSAVRSVQAIARGYLQAAGVTP